MYNKLQISCIKKLWGQLDILSLDETPASIRYAIKHNTNAQLLNISYNMQHLTRFRRRLCRNILHLESTGGMAMLNAYPHFSDSECEQVELTYNVMHMLQLTSLILMSMECYSPDFPIPYLAFVAKVNSRLYDLDVLNYKIFGQALLNSITEYLLEDRNSSVPQEQQTIFTEFISGMFSVLIEHSVDPQLDIPIIAPPRSVIKLSETVKVKADVKKTTKGPNIPTRRAALPFSTVDEEYDDELEFAYMSDEKSLQDKAEEIARKDRKEERELQDRNRREYRKRNERGFQDRKKNDRMSQIYRIGGDGSTSQLSLISGESIEQEVTTLAGELTRTNSITSTIIGKHKDRTFSLKNIFKKPLKEISFHSNASIHSLSSDSTVSNNNEFITMKDEKKDEMRDLMRELVIAAQSESSSAQNAPTDYSNILRDYPKDEPVNYSREVARENSKSRDSRRASSRDSGDYSLIDSLWTTSTRNSSKEDAISPTSTETSSPRESKTVASPKSAKSSKSNHSTYLQRNESRRSTIPFIKKINQSHIVRPDALPTKNFMTIGNPVLALKDPRKPSSREAPNFVENGSRRNEPRELDCVIL